MFKSSMLALMSLGMLGVSAASAPAAETIKALILQEDADSTSLQRNTRVQKAVLNAFNQALNAPSASDIYNKYGIGGLDVYDETAVTIRFDKQGRTRREDTELVSLARDVRNPRLDVVVLYTLYAKAVEVPYREYTKLQMALNYRALDVRSGRVLGGDNLDIDTDGVVVTGCAAGVGGQGVDPHCVHEFVADNAERLVRDAGTTLAIQLAAMSSGIEGARADGGEFKSKGDGAIGPRGESPDQRANRVCSNSPRSYLITFRGLSQRDVNYLADRMNDWPCGINLGLDRSSPSEVSFSYKVRANEAQIKRNIEMTMELMGVEGGVELKGTNELMVKAVPVRRD